MTHAFLLAVAVLAALRSVGCAVALIHIRRPWWDKPTCEWQHNLADRHSAPRVVYWVDATEAAEQRAWERFCADNADVARACRELTEESR